MNMIFLCVYFLCFATLYGESVTSKSKYPSFCSSAASDDTIFNHFRRTPIYIKAVEHVSVSFGKDILKIITTQYPTLVNKFDQFRKNDLIGDPLTFNFEEFGKFSPTTLRYIKIAGEIHSLFGDLSNLHIVEIGAGYGGQCRILYEMCGFASYTIIDLPECIALAKKYLDKYKIPNVFYVDNSSTKNNDHKFDLVISNYAFTEINKVDQLNYFTDVIGLSSHGYMQCNSISQYFDIQSLSKVELINLLKSFNKSPTLGDELPLTHPDNFLLTW